MIVDSTNIVAGPGPPTLAAIANMTVAPGTTADQGISATDPDADAIIFTSSGPSFMTLTQDAQVGTTRTGNIHLAPPISTSGTFQASITATANGQFDDQSFVITAHTNSPPTLNQPADMTVDEAATANQVLTGSDPDGDALTFTKVAGPTFMMVTTTNPTTGTVDLSPGFADAGTYPATVRASDGALSADRSFAITVNDVPAPPVLATIANMTVAPGATADQGISATDPDGDAITFTSSGPTFMTLTSNAQVGDTRTGNIHLAPPLGTSGTFQASVTATANSQFDDQVLVITVSSNRAPTLIQPANMMVSEGATADQAITGTDPDGNALTFSEVSGPTYMTVTTVTPGTGTGTGNIHLAPGFSDAGTVTATVSVSDGSLSNEKSFTITIGQCFGPFLAQPANMVVNQGTTADQVISATDACGNAVTFSKVAGPTFMTVTTTNATTGDIHLAPGFADGDGTFGATVRASDGFGGTSDKSFSIQVGSGGDRAPTLVQPANMTVSEGATADQSLNATDPDGNPLTFSKVSGPTYMTVTTTTPGAGTATGNIHLAPGFSDAGTASATVQVSDGSLTNSKSFTVTISASNRAPVLNQPANMAAREGTTADQVIVGSDPDGNPLTFSKVTGPFFMTVTTTNATSGNIHIAPPFGSVGVYPASVQASDGTLSNSKSFTITVVPASNRCPTANPGGPYSGLAGVPVNFDGTGSSDPDGDALTYAWDFDASDGVGTDAVGPTTSHAYASGGAFVVTLAVSDGVCSNSATTSASILSACPATVFNGYDVIRLGSGKPTWFALVQPASSCYANTDVVTSSFVLRYAGRQIPAQVTKTSIGGDKNGDGIQEIRVTFSKDNLRTLFTGTGLANGDNLVTVTLEANLVTGGTLQGMTQVDVFNNGSFTAATVSPNPLNPEATLTFTTAQPGFAKVEMFDIGGRLVRRILEEGWVGARWRRGCTR